MSGAWISDGSVQALKIVNFVGGMSANGPNAKCHPCSKVSAVGVDADRALFDLFPNQRVDTHLAVSGERRWFGRKDELLSVFLDVTNLRRTGPNFIPAERGPGTGGPASRQRCSMDVVGCTAAHRPGRRRVTGMLGNTAGTPRRRSRGAAK